MLDHVIGIPEVASLLGFQPATANWYALVVQPGRAALVAQRLAEELEMSEIAARLLFAPEANELSTQLRLESNVIAVIHGIDHYGVDDWQLLDVERSRLERRYATVLVLVDGAIDGLAIEAPHLASWLRHTWTVDEHAGELGMEEKEDRLWALRNWAGKSDAEVIALAEIGTLPEDPEFAEWLVLLGRGDLLGPE